VTAQKPKLTPRPAPINPLPAEPPAELLSSTEPSAESLELEPLAKSLAKLLPSTEPSAETPAEPLELEPPTEPPAGLHPLEPAPTSLSLEAKEGLTEIRFKQIFERLSRVETMIMGAVVHASSSEPLPPPPPPPPDPEQAILLEMTRFDRGELTNEEHGVLVNELSRLTSDLQQRALRLFAFLRRVRGD